MKEFSTTLETKVRQLDYGIILCIIIMTAMSVFTLAGASDAYGNYYTKQIMFAGVGFVAMIVISMIDYDALVSKMFWPMFITSIVLILAVMVFGEGKRGQANWIALGNTGFYIQPTEFVKITFIVCFAVHIDKVKKTINNIKSLIPLGLHAALICGLIFLTGDDGMAIIYALIVLFMLFIAGLSVWYFIAGAGAVLIALPFIWPHLSGYQQMRILCATNPDLDPLDVGYQAIKSRDCIISGGFRGAGFDGGIKYFVLPEGQSDFLYAVHAEKFGFIGTFAYIVLVVLLVIRIIMVGRHARKNYAAYICAGFAGMIIAQAVCNIGMNLAIFPVIGVTLPFFSYGGSSILSMYMCMGVVQSISAHNRKYYFEREVY